MLSPTRFPPSDETLGACNNVNKDSHELLTVIDRISHDFNNILTVINGNTRLILKKLEDGAAQGVDDIARKIYPIERAAQRGTELVRQLSKCVQKMTALKNMTDIGECLEGLRKTLRETVRPLLDIETVLADELWPVEISAAQLKETLLGFVHSKRPSAHETLMIEAENVTLDHDYSLLYSHVQPGPYVLITMSRMGGQERGRFLQFITYPLRREGSAAPSIGNVHDIVRQSHGYIHIYSEKGIGTVFRLYLPAAIAETAFSADEEDTSSATPQTAKGSESILIVDDDRDLANLGREMMEDLGYNVCVASNIMDAMQILEHRTVDLIFTDLVLSGKTTGLELAKKVHKQFPQIKILYTSGFSQRSIPQLYPETQEYFISKPYRKEALAEKIRDVLDEESRYEKKAVHSRY